MNAKTSRRDFMVGVAGMAASSARCFGMASGGGRYSVAVLGDTHYDAEPESVYHSHYDESNRWAKVQHEEFRRNGEMWRDRCMRLLNASAAAAHRSDTRFVLQLGDLVQGDCDDAPTHRKMLEDCVRLMRKPYPAGLPFLTVIGNHDFRGKGARKAYLDFVEPFIEEEIAKLADGGMRRPAKYPVFSFRLGGDLWVFCDFEMKNLDPVSDAIDADPGARHVFLVTHGPFTTSPGGWGFRWRLGGRKESVASRVRLYETLSRHRAVVLSGHTHSTNFYRYANARGGFSEFTVNSVWDLEPGRTATGPIEDGPPNYGAYGVARQKEKDLEDYKQETAFFRRDMKKYFFSRAAGHYRLDVAEESVQMSFYPGDARTPAWLVRL